MSTKFTVIKKSSSAIEEVMFDATRGTTIVAMKNGSSYVYRGVSDSVVGSWMKAKSSGKFFQTKIKGKFESTKIS